MSSVQAAVDFYNQFAPTLAPAYDRVSFEAVHGPLLHQLPPAPADILDIGAGSGRDAAALESIGYRVTAVEPAAALRDLGCSRAQNVRWLDDRLPELGRLRESSGVSFDFILCSAVLMSLSPELIQPSFKTMAKLLRPSGKLMISVRPPSRTDAKGVIHNHSKAFLKAAAGGAGLKLINFQYLADALGRNHQWSASVYEHL
jgi:SAM-dependent methyltransferase